MFFFTMRTSYKKHRPFDFKLIDHVEPNTILYKRKPGLTNYHFMKVKTEIWSKIAEIMECDVDFCIMRWNNLLYQYRKESRRPEGSTWPYFERLHFLKDVKCRQKYRLKPKKQTKEVANVADAVQDELQSFDDCVVMQVSEDMEQHADSTYLIEEIIEQQNDQLIQEEIIYEEEVEEDDNQQKAYIEPAAKARVLHTKQLALPAVSGYQKMRIILDQLKGKQKELAERRIFAFALKCQLRALVDEPIDDLVI